MTTPENEPRDIEPSDAESSHPTGSAETGARTVDPERARELNERFEGFLRTNLADPEQIEELQDEVEAEMGFEDTLAIQVAAYRATALAAHGRTDEALEGLRSSVAKAHEFQPGGPDETFLLEQLASLYSLEERFAEALPVFEQARNQWAAMTGGPNEQSLHCAVQAAECQLMLDRAVEAEQALGTVLQQCAGVMPPDHPVSLQALDLRSSALFALERYEEGAKAARKHLKLLTHYFGADAEPTEEARRELAVMLCFGVDPAVGVPALRTLSEETDEKLGAETWQALNIREHLGLALGRTPEHADEGERILREIAAGYESAHEYHLLARVLRGIVVTVRNNPAKDRDAERQALEENVERLEAAFGPEHEKVLEARWMLEAFRGD